MTETLLRAKHFRECGDVQNILGIIILSYKQFRDGLSFQNLFITTFPLFFLIPCPPQNMCNVGGWIFGGVGWVLLIGMVYILLHFGGFFTVVLCLYFLSLVYPTVIPCTKQSNIDLDEYLGCSWITRNQLLSEAPEKFLLTIGEAAQRSVKLY